MNRNCVKPYAFALIGVLLAADAPAQTTMVFGGGKLQISDDQKMMFEAANKTVKHDYKGAEELYSQVIARDGSNVDAYLQRGVVRRELGNQDGAMADGRTSVTLLNATMQNNARDPYLYYKRSMGYRLLRNFPQASQDIRTGIQLGGPDSWQTDLKAIELEAKEMH